VIGLSFRGHTRYGKSHVLGFDGLFSYSAFSGRSSALHNALESRAYIWNFGSLGQKTNYPGPSGVHPLWLDLCRSIEKEMMQELLSSNPRSLHMLLDLIIITKVQVSSNPSRVRLIHSRVATKFSRAQYILQWLILTFWVP
jgi:hypothetical protein